MLSLQVSSVIMTVDVQGFFAENGKHLSCRRSMHRKAKTNAILGIGNWLVATFFAQISPIALGNIGWKFYFVFVAFNIAITFPVVFFFFKETNQVSLEDIDLLFGERALGALPADLHKEGALEVLPKTVDAEVPDIKV